MAILLRYLILGLVVYAFVQMLKRKLTATSQQAPGDPSRGALDPYTVLGVSRNASKEQIKAAYKEALSKYHPDKVQHLGEELQKLSKVKTQEITEAYKRLGL